MLNHFASGTAPDGQPFQLTQLRNAAGTELTLMDWGATWVSCQVALGNGARREVLLGCATAADYPQQGAYLGATVGRYANRIAHAHYLRDEKPVVLAPNQGEHQLHGGPQGFDKRRWQRVSHDGGQVTYRLFSADGDQGFPGNLDAEVCYRLTEDNRVEISYLASTDKDCPINLTNHAYFNLDGDGATANALAQTLQLFADRYLPVDSEGIPCADLTPVEGSGMDFRQAKPLNRDLLKDRCQQRVKGYDHAYLLHTTCRQCEHPAAVLTSADKKVTMDVFTDAPALQLYSGNFLAGTPDRKGGTYDNYAGVALESEFLPDSPNHPEWPQPNCVIKAGGKYRSRTTYAFQVVS
ncbi:galactose-1-epimerase [Enterobacillus tribolii]|uniref:Aldose 1-epimerase n=1 Tax=Enterobacillus tribolii TaxID=1487935 RepID=A0A370QHI4_9GAMM|nr:galactose-1-epimerase [Enterobacillus tribolii]MBW7982541.1 galactose-1-epimerase [Enterobacillus tribolii]RDK87821.1 aldose 1-epimerase [Enterobacillus tribolii]